MSDMLQRVGKSISRRFSQINAEWEELGIALVLTQICSYRSKSAADTIANKLMHIGHLTTSFSIPLQRLRRALYEL